MKKELSKTKILILLFILVAIGGLVLFGDNNSKQKNINLDKLFNSLLSNETQR